MYGLFWLFFYLVPKNHYTLFVAFVPKEKNKGIKTNQKLTKYQKRPWKASLSHIGTNFKQITLLQKRRLTKNLHWNQITLLVFFGLLIQPIVHKQYYSFFIIKLGKRTDTKSKRFEDYSITGSESFFYETRRFLVDSILSLHVISACWEGRSISIVTIVSLLFWGNKINKNTYYCKFWIKFHSNKITNAISFLHPTKWL